MLNGPGAASTWAVPKSFGTTAVLVYPSFLHACSFSLLLPYFVFCHRAGGRSEDLDPYKTSFNTLVWMLFVILHYPARHLQSYLVPL